MAHLLSRRRLLQLSGVGAAMVLAACAPKATPVPTEVAQEPTKAAQKAAATAAPATQVPATQVPPTQAPKRVTLRQWHVWGGPPQTTWLDQAVAKFASAHPEVTVEPTYVGGSGYEEKVNAALAGGDPPDVLDTSGSPRFGARDMIIDLNPLLEVSSKIAKADFLEYQIIRCSWGDELYAIPRESDCNAIFWWNKDIYEEVGLDPESPPKSWAELLEFSKKTTKTESDGSLSRIGFMPTYSQAWFYVFLWMTGCELWEPRLAGPTSMPTVTFNAPCGELALGTMVELADAVGGATVMSSFQQGFQSGAQSPFYTGQLAMMTNGDWTFGPIKEYAPDISFGIAPMPIPENGQIVTSSGGYGYSIPADAQTEAAWSLVEFYTDFENSLERAKTTEKLSARYDVAKDPYFSEDPLLSVAAQLVAEHGHEFPEPPFVDRMWQRINVEMRDEAIFKQKTVSQALSDAANDATSYINEYYESIMG